MGRLMEALGRRRFGRIFLKLASILRPANAALIARHAAALARRGTPRGEVAQLDAAIDEGLAWLCRSQDRVGSGGVGCYEFYRWTPGYPEVTGYIIPTVWDCHRALGREDLARRATRMADWELGIQRPEGGFEGLYEGDGYPIVAFNTSQVIRGLLRTAEETGEQRYLDAAVRAGEWLVANQDEDGSWTRANFKGSSVVYDSYAAAPLARLGAVTGEGAFKLAAQRSCEFVLAHQRANGWFELCAHEPQYREEPLTHFLCYTIDGLLETGEVLDDERFVTAAIRAADPMLAIVEGTPELPARLDADWQSRAGYVCVTGVAQLGIILMRLHDRTGETRYLEASRRLVEFLIGLQGMSGGGPARGAVPGSYPVWGAYARFKMNSWGTKYLLDLLLLVRDADRAPRVPVGA
jgi:rhamnogalacturonyl hydrolase YesR